MQWVSLIPRPHPRGGKRVRLWVKSLVQLMTVEEFVCLNQITAIVQSYECNRAIARYINLNRLRSLMANQIQALFKCIHVGVCTHSWRNQENCPKSPDPFYSFRGWGLRTKLVVGLLRAQKITHHLSHFGTKEMKMCLQVVSDDDTASMNKTRARRAHTPPACFID